MWQDLQFGVAVLISSAFVALGFRVVYLPCVLRSALGLVGTMCG